MKTNLFSKQVFLFLWIFSSLTIFSCSNFKNNQNLTQEKLDSISIWTQYASDDTYTLDDKKSFLKKVFNQTIQNEDSLTPKNLSSIAFQYYTLGDTLEFKHVNKIALEKAIKLKDTFYVADVHWNYATYYVFNEVYDSAYYHFKTAHKLFEKTNHMYESARLLYSMCFIKGRYRDYTGSEVLNIQAIKIFESLKDYKLLYYTHSHLADIQNDIKEYDRAIEYHHKALGYYEKMNENDKKNNYALSLNGIGYSFSLKEDHKKAIEYFNKALNENKNDIDNYARIINNIAYSKLKLNDTVSVKKDMLESLRIRDSLGNKVNIVSSLINLSHYYTHIKDTSSSLKYAKKANNLSREIKNGLYYLETLILLSELDSKKSKEYLNEHIRFNDSLIDVERKYINKFTRIEFETDEVIKTNEVLTKQRIWIFACSIGAILILSLLYLVRVQRAKNEKLFLETEQQKANEQVYLLTLKQQATLEEEKTRERNRISQELHDGILGRLFGTRVGMGFLDIGTDEETQKQHQAFLDELQEIEKEIREVSHKLNTNFEDPDVNFTTIINQLLESKSQIGDFRFHLDIDQNISWKSTDEIIKVNVYRIIQEALQNTIKHANAQNVTLDFSSDSNQLTIRLKDDGKGFSMKKSKKGIGLKNIRSRVQKMNGTIDIVSAIGKGTEIHIKIPISQ
ncbi:ATP-binding protein [Pseudotenacibaculum haliotis]|uniref:Oxygen sensor histidine kinase NreB n=1 Tax=Pseudotenacibaculum haliotis TaxID=1862138 RepID=A0ABW5LUA4_9FLAO